MTIEQERGEGAFDHAGGAPGARFACDAMCGGLARWLRALGYDATWSAAVEDAALVEQALREDRVLISSDSRLFERKLLTSGRVKSLFLPRGLRLHDQLDFVARKLRLVPYPMPRCMLCNGQLHPRRRDEVQHLVPARSLVWATEFYECGGCGRAFWNGTHWRKIQRVRGRFAGGG